MKTIEIKLYKFSELSEEIKENAVNHLCDINVDFDWWDYIYDDAKTIGLKINEFGLDRYRHATGNFLFSACEVAQNIFNNHGEFCKTYKTAKLFIKDWQSVFNEYMDETNEKYESTESENELMELEDNFLNSLLEDYSIILQNEYEYRTSNEAIIETIEANEYYFTKEGKLY
jgi:hypothetical protein